MHKVSSPLRTARGSHPFVFLMMAVTAVFSPVFERASSLHAAAVAEEDWSFPAATGTAASLKTLSLEELMRVKVATESTVSRVDERVDEAPGSVYVYPRSVILERGYHSLGDLLQTVPGFTVFQKDLQLVAGVRGLNANDNEKITLLINGQNVNNVNEPEILNGPINLDNVERVEVVVGPSSFFQQANTLAATVNVITKNVEGSEVIAGTGNDLNYSATLMSGHRWDTDQFASFSFTSESKEGFDAWNPLYRPIIAGRKLTGELAWPSFFSVLNGQYGEVSGQVTAYRVTTPELLIDSANPLNDGWLTDQFYSLYLKDEHRWTDALTGILTFSATLKEQSRENEEANPPAGATQQVIKQMNYMAEAGIVYTGLAHHRIQAGVQFSYDDNFENWFTFDSTGPFSRRIALFSENTYGIGFYADDNIEVTRWLKLVEGVRVDQNSRLSGEQWFPGGRSAIIVEPTSSWVSKLIFNRAVRMPSSLAALNQVWGSDHLSTSPPWAAFSPNATEPEILSTLELQQIFYLDQVRLAATLYHQDLEDFITWEGPHTNVGNFRGNGVELSVRAPLSKAVTLWANGSWNDSRLHPFRQPPPSGSGAEAHHAYIDPQDRIIGSAQFTANLGLDCKLADHVTFSPAVRYFGRQAAVYNQPGGATYDGYIHNRAYLDAAVTWDHVAGRNFDLRASVNNLTNNREPVAAQITETTYRPRGIFAVFTLDARF